MSTFTVINDETLAQAVAHCRKRLVYIAPGVTEKIVGAMKAAMQRPQPPALTVIIDADPEVCRLGYGTVEGLKDLQALATAQLLPIRYQAGLRLGVLVADDQIWVYSPTPLLIEAGSDRADQPNAISLDAVTQLQYVDFEVAGYKLTARRVQIPTDLLVGSDRTLEVRLRNSFSLLEGKESLVVQIPDSDPDTGEPRLDKQGQPVLVDYSELAIDEERKKIYTDFLTPITGHGQLISKMRRQAFDTRVEWFKARVADYTVAVKEKLDQAIEASVKGMTKALLPGVMQRPPARLMKHSLTLTPTEDDFRSAIEAELSQAFNIGDRFFQPTVKVIFKDLTYETITDEKFLALLKKSFPGLVQQEIFEEHESAPEVRRAGSSKPGH
ncbi:MAG: hypothetical protein IPL06_19215 [Betaproteobacteria bacterium]|nr:hypothetical protein [Betaproteobacteria bacterium]